MPATDFEPSAMENAQVLQDGKGNGSNTSSTVPSTNGLSLTSLAPATAKPNLTEIETNALFVTGSNSSLALSSPAEASPAKPAVESPTALNGSSELSPATSHIASASDSLACAGTGLVSMTESKSMVLMLPPTTFGSPDPEIDFPATLTFQGVSVTLENNNVWKQFHRCGTEMILTKQGRRMFPYCRYRISGLEPTRQYNLVLSVVPSDNLKYRWSTSKWEVNGPAENKNQGLIRAFCHHYSPCQGSVWMGGLASFYKLKLTNNNQDQDGHVILHSMHRYIPRLHVIPVPEGVTTSPDKPVQPGPNCMTFTFPQTEFMAVTTYQNFRITQLKINHNPFAKGFREDGNNSRLNRILTPAQPLVKVDIKQEQEALNAEDPTSTQEEVVDLSSPKDHTVPVSAPNPTRLVLKPIMSTNSNKNKLYVPCMRGSHALGDLVLVEESQSVEPKEEIHPVSITPKAQQESGGTPSVLSASSTPSATSLGSSPRYRKKRRRVNKRWGNSRGREWKDSTASPKVAHSPSLTVAMQPELDDVEGLLFVSFSSKEALEVHVGDKPAINSAPASPVSTATHMQTQQTMDVVPDTDEEKLVRFETFLLQDLSELKHRQVIHPVLQEVGLKLNSVDPTQSIDLQYLGVPLPLPSLTRQEQSSATTPDDKGLSFISRTGKTSDMTKIKGWKSKFVKSTETSSSNCDGSAKNLSAFCSNMLDEYLESEGQMICERAAAFSTNPEDFVAYQLPVKSSSYVRTLDSVLKQRNSVPKVQAASDKPCPLSYKPLLNSAASQINPTMQGGAPPPQHSAVSWSNSAGCVQHSLFRFPSHQPGFSQNQAMQYRPSGLSKYQLKLMEMETGAMNEGLHRTQLTPDRLEVALSVMLTKEGNFLLYDLLNQMQASKVLKVPQYPKTKAEGPECGQDFCTLGCVCSSLKCPLKAALHCRRPECMFGCACFKHRITEQLSPGETEQQIQPVHSVTKMEHVVQPRPGAHMNKLWKRNIVDRDPEPLFSPENVPVYSFNVKAAKRSSVSLPAQQIREEDKDPVYKYFESLMTCARVREFNSKPPPQVSILPEIFNTQTQEKKTTDDGPKTYFRTVLNHSKADKTSSGRESKEAGVRKQIEIQSACQWDKDRKKVIETLCRRMNQGKLTRRFSIGPYYICPLAKISIQKPSGSLITYRVRISEPSNGSDEEKDEYEESDKERNSDESQNGDTDSEEEEGGHIDKPVKRFAVAPFLSGVLPAGRLRVKLKPVGSQANGLIQVNGKSYNQARLLLGNMGSLHPANRLAGYITGRLRVPTSICYKTSQKPEQTDKINPADALHIKVAGSVVPSTVTARKTTELKTSTQAPVPTSQPNVQKLEPTFLSPQTSNTSSTLCPPLTFVPGKSSSVNTFQSSSKSSPVSVTVSPSLKTPSFLGQSGTYSFRICPPAQQDSGAQNPPGVTLPGGFTLIQLPKHGADGAALQSENKTNTAAKGLPQKGAFFNSGRLLGDPDTNWLGLDTFMRAKELLSSGPIKPGTAGNNKASSGERNEADIGQDSNQDITSEDLSSESSDCCVDGDEEEDFVDIETVEGAAERAPVNIMDDTEALRNSQFSAENFRSAPKFQNQSDNTRGIHKDELRRKNHNVVERQRRSEQRGLFDKLQSLLHADPKTPRLQLLTMTTNEIKELRNTSRFLQDQKRKLTQIQSVYLKELSHLTGKSEKAIKDKLTEIYNQQKLREKTMKWSPFFSNLLKSRAALLHPPDPDSTVKAPTMPLLEPDFFSTPYQATSTMAALETSVNQTCKPVPPSQPRAETSPAQAEVTIPSAKAENRPDESEAPVHLAMVKSPQTECQPKGPSACLSSEASDRESTAALRSDNSTTQPKQHLTLPLIRSKTGRLILPSSLKPLGKGYYTITFLSPKKEGEDADVKSQPPEEESSSNNEKINVLKTDHSTEGTCVLESSTLHSPKDSKPLGSKAVLANLAFLQGSTSGHPSVAGAAENSRAEGSANNSKQGSVVPSGRRGRGRPRKHPSNTPHPASRMTEKKIMAAEGSQNERGPTVLAEDRQSKKRILEVARNKPAMVRNSQPPVKRGRGRPRKRGQGTERGSASRTGSNPPKSPDDSSAWLPGKCKSPNPDCKQSPAASSKPTERNTNRPLTRGALGKDFPSAKKRSWIDVEKELEPDLEHE